MDELAAVRRRAIAELAETETPADVEMLSGEETTRAILAFRLGLVDEEEFGA